MKPSYEQMWKIWTESELFHRVIKNVNTNTAIGIQFEIDAFFRSYGWSVDEYSAYSQRD